MIHCCFSFLWLPLDINPLDLSLVKLINVAEALFWHASVGTRVDDSTNILGSQRAISRIRYLPIHISTHTRIHPTMKHTHPILFSPPPVPYSLIYPTPHTLSLLFPPPSFPFPSCTLPSPSLGFDCGGEQLVCEICFNMGPLDQARALAGMSKAAESKDVSFVRRLLLLIEQHGIPAPSPIGTHPSHLPRLL